MNGQRWIAPHSPGRQPRQRHRQATTAYVKGQFVAGSGGSGAYFTAPGFQMCRTTITAPGAGSVNWTFPLAFSVAPQVFYMTSQPATSMIQAMWISGVTATGVTIFNPNPDASSINVLAVL
jgi:hypothetical protein